jgi:hypothetical protein
MMRTAWLNSLLVVGVSLVSSGPAHAQPLFGDAESIESTVANSDLVVIGKLTEFGGGKRADETEGHEITIAVEQTLKDNLFSVEPHQRLRVQVRRPAPLLANWKDHSHCLLVAVKEDAPNATTVIDLADKNSVVLTADFTLLHDPEGVIRVAHETVRRMPAAVRRIHTFGLVVPRKVVAGTKWEEYYKTGGYLVLKVPVDERLEKRAQDYIRSERYQNRQEGVRALRYFKSDENCRRVRGLLNDPGWAYLYHARENKGVEVRIYGVRQEAYRTLKSWGLDAEKPTIREEVHR